MKNKEELNQINKVIETLKEIQLPMQKEIKYWSSITANLPRWSYLALLNEKIEKQIKILLNIKKSLSNDKP